MLALKKEFEGRRSDKMRPKAFQTTDATISPAVSARLNFLRVIAAWFVLVGHGFGFNQITIFRSQEWFPYLQNIGVVLLLLLSGYLMAYRVNRDYSAKENKKSQNIYIYIYIRENWENLLRINTKPTCSIFVGLCSDTLSPQCISIP